METQKEDRMHPVTLTVSLPLTGFVLKAKYMEEKQNICCHTSKQRMSQSSAIAALQYEPVSPEDTQEEEYLLSSSHQTASTLYSEPRGNSGCESTGYWPQIAEVPMKGMISASPDSCISPYIEKTKFLNLGNLVFFS